MSDSWSGEANESARRPPTTHFHRPMSGVGMPMGAKINCSTSAPLRFWDYKCDCVFCKRVVENWASASSYNKCFPLFPYLSFQTPSKYLESFWQAPASQYPNPLLYSFVILLLISGDYKSYSNCVAICNEDKVK